MINPISLNKIEKWLVVKTNLMWVFGLLIFLLIGLFILSICIPENKKWPSDLIGLIGGSASLLGILFAILQLIEAKKDISNVAQIAEAAEKASIETKNAVRKTLSIVQVTKYCEKIKIIQENLMNDELKLVIHLTLELKEAIFELKNHISTLNINITEEVIALQIQKMGINMSLIRKAIETNSDKYKRDNIHKDFDELLNVLLELKAQLTI